MGERLDKIIGKTKVGKGVRVAGVLLLAWGYSSTTGHNDAPKGNAKPPETVIVKKGSPLYANAPDKGKGAKTVRECGIALRDLNVPAKETGLSEDGKWMTFGVDEKDVRHDNGHLPLSCGTVAVSASHVEVPGTPPKR